MTSHTRWLLWSIAINIVWSGMIVLIMAVILAGMSKSPGKTASQPSNSAPKTENP